MFSRLAREYIIAYKLMIHKKTLAGLDIDIFANIYVETIYKIVKNLKLHRCAPDFDILFIRPIVKK